MNHFKILGVFLAAAFSFGCVSTTYTKSVTVTKDASGKIVQTVEHESLNQPNQNGWPVKFEYLKGVKVGE